MQQEKDFIEREIKKLVLFLTKLIGRVELLSSKKVEKELSELDISLKNKFNFTLLEIIEMENFSFTACISKLHESHIEKLAELIYVVVKKTKNSKVYNTKELATKGVLALEHLNEKSTTFSISRMQLKKNLQQYV